MTRQCPKCEEMKPLSMFPLRGKDRHGEKRYGYCKPCHGEYQRASKYERFFNITVEEYDRMFVEQEGVCAICERPPKKVRLAVDHRHRDGLIRGLLCSGCNRALAGFRDDPERFRTAAKYLESPPAFFAVGYRYGRKGRTSNKAPKRRKKAA